MHRLRLKFIGYRSGCWNPLLWCIGRAACVCMYIYIYIYICTYLIYIYIYIYIIGKPNKNQDIQATGQISKHNHWTNKKLITKSKFLGNSNQRGHSSRTLSPVWVSCILWKTTGKPKKPQISRLRLKYLTKTIGKTKKKQKNQSFAPDADWHTCHASRHLARNFGFFCFFWFFQWFWLEIWASAQIFVFFGFLMVFQRIHNIITGLRVRENCPHWLGFLRNFVFFGFCLVFPMVLLRYLSLGLDICVFWFSNGFAKDT